MTHTPAPWSNAGIRAERDRLLAVNAELVAALREYFDRDPCALTPAPGYFHTPKQKQRYEKARNALENAYKLPSCAP